jgi:transcriptional regulator with XRE-family HTH domain
MTQADLAERSGVPLGTLKRFERLGEISLTSLLALAEVLDTLDNFHTLFPLPEAQGLDEIEHQTKLPSRASRRMKR